MSVSSNKQWLFLFGWLVFCLFICGALFLCSFFCFYAAGLNISCQQTGINRTPLRNEVKVNVLALSTIEKLLRKLIMHRSTLFALCAVPGLVCFPLLPFFSAAHLECGLQVSGCLHMKILPVKSFADFFIINSS